MYVIRAKIHHSRLEEMILIDNPNYNPAFRVGRFSGRPMGSGPTDFTRILGCDLLVRGQRNPICVWEVGGKYYVVYGASRVRAARTTKGIEFLDAIISGLDHKPPLDVEPLQSYDVKSKGPAEIWKSFKDPPLHWRVEPEGYFYFDGCMSGFDDIHNPQGALALRARSCNNTVVEPIEPEGPSNVDVTLDSVHVLEAPSATTSVGSLSGPDSSPDPGVVLAPPSPDRAKPRPPGRNRGRTG